jgi:hypothetical protein
MNRIATQLLDESGEGEKTQFMVPNMPDAELADDFFAVLHEAGFTVLSEDGGWLYFARDGKASPEEVRRIRQNLLEILRDNLDEMVYAYVRDLDGNESEYEQGSAPGGGIPDV